MGEMGRGHICHTPPAQHRHPSVGTPPASPTGGHPGKDAARLPTMGPTLGGGPGVTHHPPPHPPRGGCLGGVSALRGDTGTPGCTGTPGPTSAGSGGPLGAGGRETGCPGCWCWEHGDPQRAAGSPRCHHHHPRPLWQCQGDSAHQQPWGHPCAVPTAQAATGIGDGTGTARGLQAVETPRHLTVPAGTSEGVEAFGGFGLFGGF